MTKDFEDKIRQICTFRGDDETAGYLLSEEQFQKLFDLFSETLKDFGEEIKEEKIQLIKNSFYGSEEELNKKIAFEVAYNQAIDNVLFKLEKLVGGK